MNLLSLPRQVGIHPEKDQPIMAGLGRYGPYLRMGNSFRNLDHPDRLFDITLEEAVAIVNQPKPTRGRNAPPLKEFGKDPVSGGEMVLKSGRYGPYLTDGTVNASVREAALANLTKEQAAELLENRRKKLKSEGKWPPKQRRRRT